MKLPTHIERRRLCGSIITGKSTVQCYYLGMRAAGFVLVGGHSSRMGSDKALLPWNSRLLVQEVAANVAAAAENVALIGESARYQHLGIDSFPDARPGLGPLAGIETALLTRRGEFNLILACDMPGVKSTWLRRLLKNARETDALCLASRDGNGRVHPLCAVYRSECLPTVQSALEAGRLRLLDLLRNLGAVTLETSEAISNINTPDEWAAFGN